jgi:hypothetical protein
MPYSVELLDALTASGWYQNRAVAPEQWTARLAFEGFTFTPEAERILRSLGGLVVDPVRSHSDSYAPSGLVFDPKIAAPGEFDRVQEWQHWLKMTLSPFASSQDGLICILLGENGAIFGVWCNELRKYGSSFSDALENSLVFGRRRPTIQAFVENGSVVDVPF